MIHHDKMENWAERRHKIIHNTRKVMYYECMGLTVILDMQNYFMNFRNAIQSSIF